MPTLTLKGNSTGGTANPSDLSVSTVKSMLGVPTTSLWTVYTPTITGFGTVSASKATYKQVGDSLFIKAFFTAGTVAASLASVSLPGGFALSVDNTGKIPLLNSNTQSGINVGTYAANSASGTNFGTWMGSVVTAPNSSTTVVYMGLSVTDRGNKLIPANGNAIAETGQDFSLECEVILA